MAALRRHQRRLRVVYRKRRQRGLDNCFGALPDPHHRVYRDVPVKSHCRGCSGMAVAWPLADMLRRIQDGARFQAQNAGESNRRNALI